MNIRGIAKLAATGLIVGVSLSGCGLFGKGVSSATDAVPSRGEGGSQSALSKELAKAIAKRKGDKAIKLGEELVERSPNHAGYRMQLGEAYLLGGRFKSAEAAFNDALTLSPRDERAALKLALVKSALGKRQEAQGLLEEHRGALSASDYGLALALAGDPQAAVASLEAAARTPNADARTRQNLALAHALAGNWSDARVVASQDLAASEVDARMAQWAEFASPRSTWDQVASLLGVEPVSDQGQPVRLALRGGARPVNQMASVAPQPAPEAASAHFEIPAAGAAPQSASPVFELSSMGNSEPDADEPVRTAKVADAPMIMASAQPAKRKPIVEYVGKGKPPVAVAAKMQPKAAAPKAMTAKAKPAVETARKPVQMASAAPVSVGGGRYVVQLGAYSSIKAADQAWSGTKGKVSALASYSPVKTSVQSGGATLQRLTVGGIASKQAADSLCGQIKASGGNCFVRTGNEGAPVQMAAKKAPVKVAAKPQPKTVAKVASR